MLTFLHSHCVRATKLPRCLSDRVSFTKKSAAIESCCSFLFLVMRWLLTVIWSSLSASSDPSPVFTQDYAEFSIANKHFSLIINKPKTLTIVFGWANLKMHMLKLDEVFNFFCCFWKTVKSCLFLTINIKVKCSSPTFKKVSFSV